jgi:hypothetical protein
LRWGQRERGIVFLGSALSSLATALFCWGTWAGWCLLGLAGLWQVFAIVDVLRQPAFPDFPGKTAVSAVIFALGFAVYGPLGTLLWSYAWPSETDPDGGGAYLVNRRAYVSRPPAPGQWIWVRTAPSRTPRSGQVVAVDGQEVECTGRGWRVDGREVRLPFPGPETDFPARWRFRVPKDHVLVGPQGRGLKGQPASPLVLVARDQIVGRAWVRYYPLWDRCLL